MTTEGARRHARRGEGAVGAGTGAGWRHALAVAAGLASALLGAWLQAVEEAGAAVHGGPLHALGHQLLLGVGVALLAGLVLGARSRRDVARYALVAAVAWAGAVALTAVVR